MDTHLRISFDEAVDASSCPVLLATGEFSAPTGDIRARPSSWDDMISVSIPPGEHRFGVRANHPEWPTALLLSSSAREA